MSIERKYFAFYARNSKTAPAWEKVPEWVKQFAEFVEQTERLSGEAAAARGTCEHR